MRVLIAYEDRDTGYRARSVYDKLVRQFSGDCDFEYNFLHLEVLSVERLRDTAADEAAEADMIIVSCHGDGELSFEVKQWCDDWLGRSWKGESALVALFDRGSAAAAGHGLVREFIEDTARRGGMTFIPHAMEAPAREMYVEAPVTVPEECHALAHRFDSVPTWPRWGINE